MVTTLLTLLLLALFIWFAFWVVDSVGAPYPLNWIAKAVVAAIAIMYLYKNFGQGLI